MTATTKHTLGPWKIYQGQATMPRVVVSADGSSVADANAGFPCAEEEQDANARLIAAAPNLLEAVEALLKIGDKYRNLIVTSETRDGDLATADDDVREEVNGLDAILNAARSVIADATGGAA